jgi:hypothetical protein
MDNAAHTAYRPDIDGLRAFAVMSVVVFHAFPTWLPGGFVGVDIFFVISGFLISGIMFNALQAGTFSFSDFYARRINRIFPALILVLLATFGFAWWVLFNDELKQLGNHMSRAAVFLSNFILWHESGYFDNVAETKPLLHLWSLGIEEQFYIVWPVVVWGLWRCKTWRGPLMVALAVLSFAWNIYQSQHDLTHDFYSPLTRFWELLCGALLAYALRPEVRWALPPPAGWLRSAHVRGLLGLGLLVVSVGVTDAQHFPGPWPLLPVLGAVLVISASPQAGVNRVVFSNPVWVWVGTISYPLYLWHWPIFSFARIVVGETPHVMWRSLALVASVVLAWLTWVWVEKPLRFGWQSRYKTVLLVLAMVGVGALGYAAHKADGYPQRDVMQPHRVLFVGDIGHDAFHAYFQQHFSPCAEASIQQAAGDWKGMVRCFQSQPQAPVDVVILGDSHAEHLFLGLAEALPQVNVAFYVKGALPVLSAPEFDHIFKQVLGTASIRTVLITANWEGKLKESGTSAKLVTDLDATLKALLVAGKQVVVLPDLPQFNFDPQRCKFQRPLTQSTRCDEPKTNYLARLQTYGPALQEVKRLNPSIALLDVSDVMCGPSVCSMARNGQVLYRDNNHLNIPGSQYVGAQIVAQYPRLAQVRAP